MWGILESGPFLSQSGAFGKTEFQNFLQPWWINPLPFERQFRAFRRTELQNFLQPRWKNHLRFWVNFQRLEGLNFKIVFNHGEEIIYIFQSIWSIWKDWISKFSSTMDVVYSWIFLQITEELTVKIALPAKKSPGIFWNYDLENLEISWDFIKKYPNNPDSLIQVTR